ncbi:MAG TPA: sulfite exporter TauE/SafE family protein [Candidatus Acidoferrales bacterium]|nr:sulfite exporter TauE/SafE family protein [Candidatus Acidoferrales bacterium]
MDFHVALGGLIVGILVGLSGVGGGSLMLPVLVLLFRVSPLVAVGTDLAYSVPTKIFGAFVHGRQNTINWKLVLLLCIGGVPGALVGLASLGYLKSHISLDQLNALIKHLVGILLIVIAIIILVAALINKERVAGWVPLRPRAPIICSVAGIVGFLVAVTSIGAGSITLTALALLLPRMRLQHLVGSDIAFAAIIVPIAALGHLGLGSINWAMTGALLVGSIPGVYIGSRLCALLPIRYLRPAIAGVLVLAGAKLL